MAEITSSLAMDNVYKGRATCSSSNSSLKQDSTNNINKNGLSSCTRSNGTPSTSNANELIYDEETIDGYAFLSFNTLDDLLEYQKRDAKIISMRKSKNVSSSNVQARKHVSISSTSDTSSNKSNDTHLKNESNVKSINKSTKTSQINSIIDGEKANIEKDEEAEIAFWSLNHKTIMDLRRRCVPRSVSIVMDKPYANFGTTAVQEMSLSVAKSSSKSSISLLADANGTAPVVLSSCPNDTSKRGAKTSSATNNKSTASKRSHCDVIGDGEFSPPGRKKVQPEADVASMISRHSKRDIRLPARYHNSGMMIGNQWISPGPDKSPEKKGGKNRLAEEQQRIQRLCKPALVSAATSPTTDSRPKQSVSTTAKVMARMTNGIATTSTVKSVSNANLAPITAASTLTATKATPNAKLDTESVPRKSYPHNGPANKGTLSLTKNSSSSPMFCSNAGPREKTVLPRKNILIRPKIFSPISSSSAPSSTSSTVTSSFTSDNSARTSSGPKIAIVKPSVSGVVNGKHPVNKIINRDGPTINGPMPSHFPNQSQSLSKTGRTGNSSPPSSLRELHESYRSLFLECKPERKLHFQMRGIKPRVNKLDAVEEAISVIKKHQKREKQLTYIKHLLSCWHDKLDLCLQVINGRKVSDTKPPTPKDIISKISDVLAAYQGSACYNRLPNIAQSIGSSASSIFSETSSLRDGSELASGDNRNGSSFPLSPSESTSSSASSMRMEDINSNEYSLKISEMPSVNVTPFQRNVPASCTVTKEHVLRQTLLSSKPKSVQVTIGSQPSSPMPVLASFGVKKRRGAQSILAPRKAACVTSSTIPAAHENHDPTISLGPPRKDPASFNASSGSTKKDMSSKMIPPNEPVLSVNGPRVALNNGLMPNLNLHHWRENGLSLHQHPPHLTNPTASGSATSTI